MNQSRQSPTLMVKNVSFTHDGIIKPVEDLPTVSSYKGSVNNSVIEGPVTATILSGRYTGTTLTGTWEKITAHYILPYGNNEHYTLKITDNGIIDNNEYDVKFSVYWPESLPPNSCKGKKSRVKWGKRIYMPDLIFYVKNGKKTFFGLTPKSKESKCEILDEFMVLLEDDNTTKTVATIKSPPMVDARLIQRDNEEPPIAVASQVNGGKRKSRKVSSIKKQKHRRVSKKHRKSRNVK